jgi:pilus assembly protein Flp/PilA
MITRIRRGEQLKDRGASAVEYGLMVAAIAAVIVGIVFGLGGVVSGVFTNTCQTVAAQGPSATDDLPNTECSNQTPTP